MKRGLEMEEDVVPNKPLQTFISYSRVNQQFAIRLASELKSAGFCVWLDQFDIPTGARWDDAIEKALRESQIFLFIMTPASTASENAKDEMGYAIDHGKHILPVLLEPCEVPLRLRRMQYVDFTRMSFDKGIRNAKELLSELIDEIERSQSEASMPANGSTAERQSRSSVREPKTAPTRSRTVPYDARTRSRQPNRRVFQSMVLGIGILLIGVVIAGTLMFKPPFLSPSTAPSQTVLPLPTETAVVINVPVLPTNIEDTATPEILRSFTENFGSNSRWETDWNLQLRHPNPQKESSITHPIEDGALTVDIRHEFVWGYFLYRPDVVYKHVELETVASDLNSVDTIGLVCQFSKQGWYEFDINGGGTYEARYVDSMESSRDEDGNRIKFGSIPGFKDSFVASRENIIRAICDGNHLSLYVNDTPLMEDFSSSFALEEGQVGLTVRSYSQYPVHVSIKSITVTEQ